MLILFASRARVAGRRPENREWRTASTTDIDLDYRNILGADRLMSVRS